ncbi:MAG: rod shape-determining protein MreD [Candidatus Halalkalibacterium sp. M3_1C_030]
MNLRHLKDFGIGLGFVALQIVLFRHLKIYEVQADLVLIYLIWYMTQRDRTTAIIMAALLGFFQDAFLDLWGLNMFSKTLIVFSTFNIIPKTKEIRLLLGQVFLSILLIALAHNLVYLGLSTLVEQYSAELLFWRRLAGNSIYTAIVGSFIYLFRTS